MEKKQAQLEELLVQANQEVDKYQAENANLAEQHKMALTKADELENQIRFAAE